MYVLTLLKNRVQNIHTEEICRNILRNMETRVDYRTYERLLRGPENVGLNQEEVDRYYSGIRYYTKNPFIMKYKLMKYSNLTKL